MIGVYRAVELLYFLTEVFRLKDETERICNKPTSCDPCVNVCPGPPFFTEGTKWVEFSKPNSCTTCQKHCFDRRECTEKDKGGMLFQTYRQDQVEKADVPLLIESVLVVNLIFLDLLAGIVVTAMEIAFIIVYIKQRHADKLALWVKVRMYLFIMDGVLLVMNSTAMALVCNDLKTSLTPGFALLIFSVGTDVILVLLAMKRL